MAEDSVLEQSNLEYKSLQSKSSEEQSTIEHDAMDAVKYFAQKFAQKFANGKQFIALKILNWVLLLGVAILSTIGGTASLRLYNWSNKVFGWHSSVPKIGPEDHWNAIPVAIWAMFVLATYSLGMYCYGKKYVEKSKTFLSCLAIVDICFSLFFLINLSIALAHFLSQAIAEYLWFYPSLVNHAPLENLTEFESWRYSTRKPQLWPTTTSFTTTTPRPTSISYFNLAEYKLEEMAKRKQQILARLALDPTVAILATLAILVNIVYVYCIRKAMKQSNMRPSNYEESHPHCSEMDSSYTKFCPIGLLKIVHWVIPAFLFHAILYRITEPDDNGKFFMVCWFGICFYYWISYVKSTQFPSEDYSAASGSNRFLFVMDFVVYGSGIIFYLVTYFTVNSWTGDFIKKVSLIAGFFFMCSIFANLQLMFKYGGFSEFGLISINVSIVTKHDNQDSGSDIENSASDRQERVKYHSEKEKGLDYIDI